MENERKQEGKKHGNKICQRNIVFVAVETRSKFMSKRNRIDRHIEPF